MTACIHAFHNGVLGYMLKFGLSAIKKTFETWVVFVKAIFSCFNLKSGDRFLSYNMTEVVNIPPLLKGERGGGPSKN